MGDVVKVERIILGLDRWLLGADASRDGRTNMGDVVEIEMIILGIDTPTPTLTPTPTPSISNVQITYIFYDGLVPNTEADEYVEVKNLGNAPQDLNEWVLKDISDGSPSFTFPHYILQPGATI